MNSRSMIIRAFFFLLCIISFSSISFAQDKAPLKWFIWDLPPEFVSVGPYKNQGYADKFLQFFIDNLPQYEHSILVVNIPRWSVEALKPNRCSAHIWGGFFPDKLLLSKPYSFTPPHVVIFPKHHQKRIGPKGTIVSLEKLLQQTDLRLVIMPLDLPGTAQSRYPVLYPYLAPYVGKGNLIQQNSSSNTINLNFLNLNRGDYTIGYPSTITTQIRVNELDDNFISYPLKEHDIYKKVYVACNNDDFGRQVIERVNALITDETLLKFLSYHEEWNNNDQAFRRNTIDYFINRINLKNVIE